MNRKLIIFYDKKANEKCLKFRKIKKYLATFVAIIKIKVYDKLL
jgi:hypothetical protein